MIEYFKNENLYKLLNRYVHSPHLRIRRPDLCANRLQKHMTIIIIFLDPR